MSRIPNKKSSMRDKAHRNFMGGLSYDINDPLLRLRVAATSCFFGEPMYYHRDKEDTRNPSRRSRPTPRSLSDHQVDRLADVLNLITPRDWYTKTPAELMESAIDDALNSDAEATLQFAAELRQSENIRTTPQVILVRAAHHGSVRGTGLVRKYGREIIKRADEPSVCVAYHKWRFEGKPLPNSLKKALGDVLAGFNEYQLAKYRMESHAVKTVDVINLVHPKGTEAITKLINGELTTAGETWESIISAGGSTKENWTKAIDKMGHMALLRNLRNFGKNGVDEDEYIGKLIGTAKYGKQLPFRYYSAFNVMKSSSASGKVLDAIEECMELSIGNLPRLNGRVMSLSDNSGSAHGSFTSAYGSVTVSDIANLTAVLTGKCADDGHVGIFGDNLKTFSIRKKASIMDQHEEARKIGSGIGGSTEHGIWLFWDKAIKEKQHWDHVFVYSDMQAGHGGLYGKDNSYRDFIWGGDRDYKNHIDVPKLITEYRRKVNPNVFVYLVQVAGYQDTIFPEFYDRTYIWGGWSDSVIRFAAAMSNMFGQKQQDNQA